MCALVERTQRFLYEMISLERCTRSAQSGREAHLFGRRDKLLKRKWRLSGRVTSWTQKGEKQESNGRKRSEGLRATQKTLKLIYCGLFPGSIHCELFNPG